jgi:hypothetical protein
VQDTPFSEDDDNAKPPKAGTRGLIFLAMACGEARPARRQHPAPTPELPRLDTVADSTPIEMLLARTPRLGHIAWSCEGIILGRVRITPQPDASDVKATLVGFARLVRQQGTQAWQYRDTPPIHAVPFRDENDVEWSALDGRRWALNDSFVIARKALAERVQAVPEYQSDARPWWERVGAKSALDAAEKVLKARNTPIGVP